MRKIILAVGAVALGLTLAACGGSSTPAQTFDTGSFTAGKDVVAGTYVANQPLDPATYRCEWSVLNDAGMTLGADVTSKDRTHLARRVLVLTDGLTVQTSGCGPWTLHN